MITPDRVKTIIRDVGKMGRKSSQLIHILVAGRLPCKDLSYCGEDEGRVIKGVTGSRSLLFFHISRIVFWVKKMCDRYKLPKDRVHHIIGEGGRGAKRRLERGDS